MVKLDIISDPICPWCYIGKTLLDRALEARPEHLFIIEWHPFQLNPDMPETGMDRRTYLEQKFGSKDRAVKVYGEIAAHAEAAGIVMDFEQIKRTPNTLNAHRLIHWAGIEGCQTPVVSALFRAYFKEGQNIGNIDVLTGIAETAGMDKAVVNQLLDGDADRDEIRARDAAIRDMGVNAVPTFIVANHHVVSGSQPPELWFKVIDELSQSITE